MYCEHVTTLLRKTTHLTTSDGLPLLVRQTTGAGATPQRTVVVVHGAGEHSQRYEPWTRLLAQHNWRVVSFDHRGYGLSGGLPGHVDRFEQYLTDLDQVWRELKIRPQQTVVFGHSLGGLIAVRYAQTRPFSMRGLVLTGPLLALQVKVPVWKRTLARLCAVFAPRTRFRSTIRPDQLTRDPAARRVRENDPLRCLSVTANWYFQVLDAMVAAWEESHRLTIPTLLLQGDSDDVVNPKAAMKWWLTLPSQDKTLRLFQEHFHELLSEPDWMHTAEGILSWLEHRFPEIDPLANSTAIHHPKDSIPGLGRLYSLSDSESSQSPSIFNGLSTLRLGVGH